MSQALRQKIIRSLKIAGVATLLFVSIFSFWHSIFMPMDRAGEMAGCPFMGEFSVLCRMGATGHIERWQTMFTAVPQKLLSVLLAAVLLLSVIIRFIFYRRWHLWRPRLCTAERAYTREHSFRSFFNYLTEAFAQGILHPRLYA
jgi:O-antigen/teichoic acid export membrane protein